MSYNTAVIRTPQVSLNLGVAPTGAKADCNKVMPEDRAAHDWYRFVLSFPPHLVRRYLERFGMASRHVVLDPFCGTGTTVVECKKLGIPSVGLEAHPMGWFASSVKTDWSPDPQGMTDHARRVAGASDRALEDVGWGIGGDRNSLFEALSAELKTLPPEAEELLLSGSISPLPLHKTLVLLEQLNRESDPRFHAHELLALGKALVNRIANLHFGPEVGVGPPKQDAPVVSAWLDGVMAMAEDLRVLRAREDVPVRVLREDARRILDVLEPLSVDAVITSPPYPNEKDYTRTTRLESVVLGFIRTKAELKGVKQSLMRSNTRNVYKDDDDDLWVAKNARVAKLAEAIESRRLALGKTSGFERQYARVTRLYFGGMARHLAHLRTVLRPGAMLAYVVGDQASYLRVMIRTGQILAEIAESLGYRIEGIDLFRTRLATATKQQLREEVIVLRWPGTTRAIGKGRTRG